MKDISRRDLLKLSGGLVAFAACARSTDKAKTNDDLRPTALSLVMVSPEFAIGDRRVPFALFDGPDLLDLDKVGAELVRPDGGTTELVVKKYDTSMGRGGDDDSERSTSIYVGDADLASAGYWTINAAFELRTQLKTVSATFQVLETSASIGVGGAAVASVTPTVSNAQGVDPICTRVPACGLHELSVAQAIQSGRPSVIVFATPEFCTSRTCGPIVDIVESASADVTDVSFVHVEIFMDREQSERLAAVTEWALPSEPWIVFVNKAGLVRARWSGAAAHDEIRAGVEKLRAGTL